MENPETKTARPPPSADQETDSKRLKMSTSNTSEEEDNNNNNDTTVKKQRYKRRKIAILFAYCGVGYQGMQKNPGAKTIEGELDEALFHSGAVPEHDRGIPKRYDWARSARTDKGVSAVGQVVSGRFYIDPPGFIERLNSNLPDQFRIFGFKRVTGSFSAKKFCDRRRYVYLIPVFALDPSAHRDRESVLASMGSGSELVKCVGCSERGRKVVGVMGKRTFDQKPVNALSSNSLNNNNVVVNTEVEENCSNDVNVKIKSVVETSNSSVVNNGETVESRPEQDATKPEFAPVEGTDLAAELSEERVSIEEGITINEENHENGSKFSYGEEEKEKFNRILNYYVGSHNFHNFTTRTKAEDPAAHRFIISFTANTVVTVDGIDFVKCEVVGQSFMLHQIRKMVGLAVAIMRNCAPESLIETAFQKDVNITVPTAPEVGLYLDECFFTSYNKKWKDTHEEVSMTSYIEEAEDFKMKHIYPHIASTEHKEGTVGVWLHSLNLRNYPDLGAVHGKASAVAQPDGTNKNAETTEKMESEQVNSNGEVETNGEITEPKEVNTNGENTEPKEVNTNGEITEPKEVNTNGENTEPKEVKSNGEMETNVEITKAKEDELENAAE